MILQQLYQFLQSCCSHRSLVYCFETYFRSFSERCNRFSFGCQGFCESFYVVGTPGTINFAIFAKISFH